MHKYKIFYTTEREYGFMQVCADSSEAAMAIAANRLKQKRLFPENMEVVLIDR